MAGVLLTRQTDADRTGTVGRWRQRLWVCSCSQWMPTLTCKPLMVVERQEECLCRFQREHGQPCRHWGCVRTAEMHFHCFKPPSVVLCYGSPRKRIYLKINIYINIGNVTNKQRNANEQWNYFSVIKLVNIKIDLFSVISVLSRNSHTFLVRV